MQNAFVFTGKYKPSMLKTFNMEIKIYDDSIDFEGFIYSEGVISTQTVRYRLKLTDIKNAKIAYYKGKKCVSVSYSYSSSVVNNTVEMLFFDLNNPEECCNIINKAAELQKKKAKQIRERQLWEALQRERELEAAEIEAKEFFDKCYSYHIKENTPVFEILSEKNKGIYAFVGEDKSLTFIRVDGYSKDEDIGIIPYDKIHYYEKAGNVHYVTNINGDYSSFGGSLTGSSFSKKAALFHGILFGAMGMAAAAMMSYKPAEQKPAETHFELSSEAKRIDERNVLLNFYSDEKHRYIDIELPQEIYNFLQTYLPHKKYSIVSEIEKQKALQASTDIHPALGAPTPTSALPSPNKSSLDEFKEKAEKLKIMRDAGLLSDEEFIEEKNKLLLTI